MSVTSDANGQAVFAGTGLVLGGNYSIDVQPVLHEGIQLALNAAGGAFIIGTTSIMQNIAMADLVPGTQDGLYITSTSNSNPTAYTTTGVLTITFSRAVTMGNEASFTATLGGGAVSAVLNTPGTDTSVLATLSVDGMTLTLTPAFTTNPVVFTGSNAGSADNGLTTIYSGGVVRLADATDSDPSYSVFGTLVSGSGNTLNVDGLNIVQTTPGF